jgi:hypothetical protein
LVQNNFTWLSGNEKIDNFIKEIQSNDVININNYKNIKRMMVFEWIPYNQFIEIKEIGKNDFIVVYSAIWKDGPLHFSNENSLECIRSSNKEVALKCLQNSQDNIEFLINEV